MLAKIFAATVLLICIGLAARMALPSAQRYRLDAFGRRIGGSLRRSWSTVTGWRRHHAMKKTAAAQAEAAIRRARSGGKPEGEWDGNVYRPKNFGAKKKPDKRNLH